MPLVDGDDLVARYDRRRLADLVADAGTRVDPSTVEDHANVAVAIDDALAMLLSAVRVSSRYTADDLRAEPPPAANDEGKSLVKRIVCDLAFGLLNSRRGYAADEMQRLAPRYFEALQQLELLRRGERILDSDTHAAAGLPGSEPFRPLGSSTPSLLSDAHRYFGWRVSTTSPVRW